MKKFSLLLVMLMAGLLLYAGDFAFLVFTNAGGTTTALSVENLTMTIGDSQLAVTNSEGTVNFVLTDLVSMQFSKDGSIPSAVENVLNLDASVEVFSVSGASLGIFDNVNDAAGRLGNGTYVIINGTNAQTIVIR